VQAEVIPVGEAHVVGAGEVVGELAARGVRTRLVPPDETLAKRVRNAELQKIPYVVVVGDRELEEGTLALRIRGERDVSVKPRSAALEEIVQAATL
jgi:threonyl-tRNA synthetase